MIKFAVATAALLLAGAASAQTDDAPSWTGPYVGVHAGYGFDDGSRGHFVGETSFNQAAITAGVRPGSLPQNRSGGLGGGQIGYNYQMGGLVLGGEIDGSYLREHGVTDFTGGANRFSRLRSGLNWMGTARARVGVLAGPKGMFYLTGGYAAGGVRGSAQFTGDDTFFGKHSYVASGYTGGGGLEFRPFSQGRLSKVSLRAETLYYNLGTSHIFSGDTSTSAGGGYTTTIRTRGFVSRMGLNYAF